MISKTLCTLLLALSATASGENSSPAHVKPSNDSSKVNSNRIFNAIHSAGRQWGSSYYHNGFSFFPAVMPKGTVLYHGDRNNTVPAGPEWLAFEIEHAEGFAMSHKGRWGGPGGPPPGQGKPPKGGDPNDPNQPPPPPPPSDQKEFSKDEDEEDYRQELRRRRAPGPPPGRPGPPDGDDDDDVNVRGHLHTYQAARELDLLYIDGMSAGKTSMGTLDSQDLLLRENSTRHKQRGFDEYPRALDLCDLATEWGFDGVVRMEAGFEVIFCDFSDGLKLISMTRTMMPDNKIGDSRMGGYMWARAIAERYDGLGDRLRIDFSSMVSALFFPINISSTDAARPDLVRLEAAGQTELKDIKNYLGSVVRQPRKFTVNWQSVVDLIVSRFSKRMASMAFESLPWNYFIDEVETVTATWFDAAPLPNDISVASKEQVKDDVNRTSDAIKRCRKNFLRPATIDQEWWSEEDHLIFTAIDTVMGEICENLFFVRELLFHAAATSTEEDRESKLESAVKVGRENIQRLMFDLGWTIWKQSQPCPDNQVLFIAMWPFGNSEDHWNPGCRTIDGLGRGGPGGGPGGPGNSSSYWRMNFGGPRGGPGGKPRKQNF